jgi:hypothetical protein
MISSYEFNASPGRRSGQHRQSNREKHHQTKPGGNEHINEGRTTGHQWAELLATPGGSHLAAPGHDLMAAPGHDLMAADIRGH